MNAPDHDTSQKCIHRTQGVAVSPIRCRYCTDICNTNYPLPSHVQITASDNAEDLIKSDRLTAEEWEEAKLQLHSKRRPVCIAQDGLPVFDDVGNLYGYAAFLRCINRDARKNNIADEDDNSPYPYHDKAETLAWARSLGWSKRRVSNKNLL